MYSSTGIQILFILALNNLRQRALHRNVVEGLIRSLATWRKREADLRVRRGERSASNGGRLSELLKLLLEVLDAVVLFLSVVHLLLVHARHVVVLVV